MIRCRSIRAAFFAACAATAIAAATPSYAQNPCKSDDPAALDDALRLYDCGNNVGYRDWENRHGEESTSDSVGRGDSSENRDYSHLPTTFSGWYNSLSIADKAKFNARLVEQANVGGRQLSQREIDALLTLVSSELDSYFASEELTTDQRRRVIAEIAVESGVGLGADGKRELSPDDAIFGSDRRRFGDADYNDYGGYGDSYSEQGWERGDPTDPSSEFGYPDNGSTDLDLDSLGDF